MAKQSKIKNNLSPICLPCLALTPSPELKKKITNIELKYKFKDETLLQGLNELLNWLQLEQELDRQKLRPADEKKIFMMLKVAANELLLLLDKSGGQVRNKINDILITKDFLKNVSVDTKRSAVPYIIEESLEIFEYACSYAVNHVIPDKGGNRPNSSMPKKIIFQLIKLYSNSTDKKPICYDDSHSEAGFNGKFYDFLIELNPILLDISPEMNLGEPATIGDYAKECIAKDKKFTKTPA